MFKPFVYLASPYTKGDVAINTRFQCEIFDTLLDDDRVWPIIPLWTHLQHSMFPRPAQDWIDYGFALLSKCDCVLRLDAMYEPLNYHQHDSVGADAEVKACEEAGKPVFFSVDHLYRWVDEQRNHE